MFHSESASRLAKVFAGVFMLGFAGIAAYEILTETVDGPKAAVLADVSASTEEADLASGLPDSLAFGDEDVDDANEPAASDEQAGPGPELVILSPTDDSHHDTSTIVFEGTTEPGAAVYAGPYDAEVGDDGSWRIALVLSPGANGAKISARDSAGNVTERAITVWLDAPDQKSEQKTDEKVEEKVEEPIAEEEPKNVAFSANQQYGTCEEVIPFDVFWGTATPKTAVVITSSYGTAEVEVDKFGNWEKKVFFENAPRGDEFAVTVTAVNGSKSFEFVALPLPE